MKKQTLLAAVCVGLVLSTCSAINGVGQMLLDAGETMVDAGNGNAQTAPPRTLTADTDVSRQEGGLIFLSTTTEVVTGPVVVLNLFANNPNTTGVEAYAWLLPAASTCALRPANDIEVGNYHVGRLFVPDGQKLCAATNFGSATLLWSGFRPY